MKKAKTKSLCDFFVLFLQYAFLILTSIFKLYILAFKFRDFEMDAFTEEMLGVLTKERDELLIKLEEEDESYHHDAENTSGMGDAGDLASDEGSFRKAAALNQMDAKRLKSVVNAIKRINDGKYGYCLQCGKKIPEGRLRAIPSAVLCIDCQSENEKMMD